ncbi:hypothetical protein N478_02010 [Pseudoalteromonas luteoviolacea S4060-1]|uniref:Uncharacterized protein n=1 Tax=Pseudoalteromonas luteoviolacea S4060-1 TaxID=1365257 RepID=A0A167N5U3_9GAMM|nr:hypothetical protein N478_02010 [Pseudoalteromonas luteoviolacea S4060-1]
MGSTFNKSNRLYTPLLTWLASSIAFIEINRFGLGDCGYTFSWFASWSFYVALFVLLL